MSGAFFIMTTFAFFHGEGKVPVLMQSLKSLIICTFIKGHAFLTILAVMPSSPGALSGADFHIARFFRAFCGLKVTFTNRKRGIRDRGIMCNEGIQ